MSEKLYPCLRESDNLDIRLKEINSFNNSIQNIKDIQKFYNHEAKKYKKKSKIYKIINGLIQSINGVSVLAVSACVSTSTINMCHVECHRSWSCCCAYSKWYRCRFMYIFLKLLEST